jgi:hypothetical protein
MENQILKTPGLEFSKPRRWLSISDLVTVARCRRKFFYSTECLLGSGSEDHVALTFGEAIHAALPVSLEKGIDLAYEEFCKVWGDDRTADDKRNNITAMGIISEFYEKNGYGNGMYELIKPSDHPAFRNVNEWEIPFCLELGLHVPFVGRIDGLARLRADNSLWCVEYKTTSQIGGSFFFDAFNLSPQCIAYTLAGRTLIPQEEVKGTIVVAIRVSKTNSESIPQPIFIRDHHIERFIHWAREQAEKVRLAEELGYWPEEYSGCHPYAQFGSHGYPCEFMTLCRDTEDWTRLRDTFRVKEDRPYDVLINGKERVIRTGTGTGVS